MSPGEIAYLAMAIGAAVIFAITMAWASHRTRHRTRHGTRDHQ